MTRLEFVLKPAPLPTTMIAAGAIMRSVLQTTSIEAGSSALFARFLGVALIPVKRP